MANSRRIGKYEMRSIHRLHGCILATLAWSSTASGGILDPAGANAQALANLFWLVVAICSVIFLAVFSTLAVFIVRFRERLDDGKSEPPQIYGSEPIEIAWMVAPAMVVLILALVTVRSIIELREIPKGPTAETVRVVGHQWWWEFEYPEYGFTTANEIVIPVSQKDAMRSVALQLESADVIHSFWVPRLAGKTDNVPGRTNMMWIQSDQEATYFGRCAEYCGTQHTKMLFRVDVVSESAYRDWVKKQQQPAVDRPAFHAGRDRFLEMSCANCHTIRGTPAVGKFGPDLTHLMSRKTLGSATIDNNPENLKEWLRDPDQFKADCYMPNFRLNKEDLQLITNYLATLE